MLPSSPSPSYAHVPPPPPGPEELCRLVRAVAARYEHGRGLRIGADNSGAGWVELEQLIAEESCFAVRVKREILAFDADTPRAVRGLRKIASSLRRRGLEYVHLQSGGPDREHLFVRARSPHLRDSLCREALASHIDVRDNSPIRPPGVKHRSGVQPTLLSPSSWSDAARVLEPQDHESRPRLSGRLWKLIQDGDLEGRYRDDSGRHDGSALVMGICHLARAEGVDAQTIYDLLRDPDNQGGAALRSRGRRRGRYDARWWFHHTWRKAATSGSRKPGETDLEAIAELEDDLTRFLATPRSGQRGNSDTAVYTAMIRTAQHVGARVAPMSVRVLAERSGKDVKTVRAALPRLVEAGLVTLVDPAHLDRAATWEITRIVPTGPSGGTGGCESGGNLRVDPGHDGFAHGALGTGAWRVLNALDTSELADAKQIAETIGMHPGSIRRHIQRLVAAGLIEECEGMWRRVVREEAEAVHLLDRVAEHRGTAGRRGRRHRRFELERQRLREVLTSNDELLRRRMELALSRGGRKYFAGIIAGRRAA